MFFQRSLLKHSVLFLSSDKWRVESRRAEMVEKTDMVWEKRKVPKLDLFLLLVENVFSARHVKRGASEAAVTTLSPGQ